MIKKFTEILTEAKASVKTGRMGHYGVAKGLHGHVGKTASDVHAHLEAAKKKHGYTSHTVEHGVSDKHREEAAYTMGPAQHHVKHTLTHPDGHTEHVYVSHGNDGRVGRIGHTSSTAVGHHDIHRAGKTLAYRDGVKKHTIHHTANGMHYEYHDKD